MAINSKYLCFLLKKYFHKGLLEAGCDEAGRGCLAGPVYAAAVILTTDFKCPDLNDSKQVNEQDRKRIRKIIEDQALDFAVASVSPKKIDKINILNASIHAMHLALDKLKEPFEHILVDGNRFKPYPFIPHHCIIKGDAKFMSIAAASILAKTYRDDYMEKLHKKHPEYNWLSNKGYPTIEHRRAVIKKGSTTFHRKTFRISNPDTKIHV